MTRKVWFQTGIAILLVLLIVKYFVEINWIFKPLLTIAKTIFVPLLLGAVFFYIFQPLQKLLEKYKFPRWASITSVLIIGMAAIWVFFSFVGPPVVDEVNKFAQKAPTMAKEITKSAEYVLQHRDDLPSQVNEWIDKAANSIQSIAIVSGRLVVSFFQSIVQTAFTLILVPFFFIFLLKDHEKLSPFICKFFTGEKKKWIQKTLGDMNLVLKTYIQGQILISFLLATIMFIGYLIIGLEYALLLVIFAFFMNVIPFIGPWIAFVPALVIAFLQDPTMKLVVLVCIVTLIAQQTDSNLITPNVMGKTLDIHPLTVITIILAAGKIAGFIGILLAIPAYAVGKAVITNIYERRQEIKLAAIKDV